MEKKKLKLEDLKVKSFVTGMEEIKGGGFTNLSICANCSEKCKKLPESYNCYPIPTQGDTCMTGFRTVC